MKHPTPEPFDPWTRLTGAQRSQLDAFKGQLLHFNRRINLISRETEASFEERHLLHALALTYKAFPPGSTVVDWGTGGGIPAIPLAIACPLVTVHAVDAVGKKIQCVTAMSRRLGLANVHPWQGRAEAWPGTARYSVSRATAPLDTLWGWHLRVRPAVPAPPEPGCWPAGLLCLKGGDLTEEVETLSRHHPDVHVELLPLKPLLGRPGFADKYLIVVCEESV